MYFVFINLFQLFLFFDCIRIENISLFSLSSYIKIKSVNPELNIWNAIIIRKNAEIMK